MATQELHIIHAKKTFEKVFREYFPGLVLFALKYVPDEDTARDICHTVFINLWDKRDEVNFEKPMKSYLFTAVYNRCLNHLRDNKKFDRDELTTEKLETNQDADYRDALEENENEQEIYAAIQALPEKCREIFLLSRFEELKYAQIAEKLDISVKTVEAQMSKALKILREKLIKYLHLIIWVILHLIYK
ncbi:MAG: RNA polymerase sigma-70 factor [Bacteroidota bacterium]